VEKSRRQKAERRKGEREKEAKEYPLQILKGCPKGGVVYIDIRY
jgi:hypothetical protein